MQKILFKQAIVSLGISMSILSLFIFFHNQPYTPEFFYLLSALPFILSIIYLLVYPSRIKKMYLNTVLIPFFVLYFTFMLYFLNLFGNLGFLAILIFPTGMVIILLLFVIRLYRYKNNFR